MADFTDRDLLANYVERGSQAAFAEFVSRYVNAVYSAAARQVRDRAAAQDVTQVVFIVLARRAASLRSHTILLAWLLGVPRFAAKDPLKAQSRRRRHEQAAGRQGRLAMETEAAAADDGVTCRQLNPLARSTG